MSFAPNKLTELETAMLKRVKHIINNERRTFSFKDFLHFEVDGKEHTMTQGTFRNKISKLRDMRIVELAYNSGIAFYTLTGIKITRLMTPNHIGIQPLLQHIRRVPGLRKHPLYKLVKHHPFDRAAVHDIHLKLTVVGLWSILSKNIVTSRTGANGNRIRNVNRNSGSLCILETDPYSKDIRLERRSINELDIQVTVHHTDIVTVIIGCSFAPIVVDEIGVIRLSDALAKIEEGLSQLIKQCGTDAECNTDNENNARIYVPNHMSWIVTRWDFGVDGLVTYTGPPFFFSWGSSKNVLIVIYTKEWTKGDYRIRVEIQEFPDKSLGEALKEKLSPKKGS